MSFQLPVNSDATVSELKVTSRLQDSRIWTAAVVPIEEAQGAKVYPGLGLLT